MQRHVDAGGHPYGAAGTANANLLAWWGSVGLSSGDTVFSVSAGNGRTTGTDCLRINLAATNRLGYLVKALDAQATWGIAFAIKLPSIGAHTLVQFLDGASIQLDLRLVADGSLSVTRNGTALGSTAAGLVTANAWIHIEFKGLIHPSAGTVYVAVGGVQKLSLTAQNTRATANSSATQVALGIITAAFAGNADLADVVIYDGQATDANGLADITGPIGDCGVYWLAPTGAGSSTQFTPDSGSNYARVNEAIPDGDTSYVEDATVGQIDLYALADLPAGISTVKSAALVHYARKTDTGSRQLGAELRSGGTNYVHATGVDLGNTYGYSLRNWGADPATSAAWTASGINALEIGEKVNS